MDTIFHSSSFFHSAEGRRGKHRRYKMVGKVSQEVSTLRPIISSVEDSRNFVFKFVNEEATKTRAYTTFRSRCSVINYFFLLMR